MTAPPWSVTVPSSVEWLFTQPAPKGKDLREDDHPPKCEKRSPADTASGRVGSGGGQGSRRGREAAEREGPKAS